MKNYKSKLLAILLLIAMLLQCNLFTTYAEGTGSNIVIKINDEIEEYEDFDVVLYYLVENDDYIYMRQGRITLMYGDIHWTKLLDIGDIDWSISDKCMVVVSSDNKAYKPIMVTKEQSGSTIEIAPDENYFPISIDIPFAEAGLRTEVILHYRYDGVNDIYMGSYEEGAVIPEGSYNIQITALDDKYGYCIYKYDYYLSKSNNVISIKRDEVDLISLSIEDAHNNTLTLDNVYAIPEVPMYGWYENNYNCFDIVYSVYAGSSNALYISKDEYEQKLVPTYTIERGEEIWEYTYRTPYMYLEDGQTVKFDTNLKADLNMYKDIYYPEEYLDRYNLSVKDSYNNNLTSLRYYDIEGVGILLGEVELENNSGFYKYDFSELDWSVQLPSDAYGTYNMKLGFYGSLFDIAPAYAKINIGIANGIGTEIYQQIDNAKSKEEIIAVVSEQLSLLSEEQKQDNEAKEEIVKLAEYAIEKAATAKIASQNNIASIAAADIKQQVSTAREVKAEIESILAKNSIDTNRELQTNINVDITGAIDTVAVTINKDVATAVSGIDNLKINTGEVQVGFIASELEAEIGSEQSITVEIAKKKMVAMGKGVEVAALGSLGMMGYKKDLTTAEDISGYDVKFKKGNNDAKKLDTKVSLAIPVGAGSTEYNCVFVVTDMGKEAVGGKYNELTGNIEVKTKESGTYYSVENKVTFDDISHKDDSMKKAIELMASKGVIGGRGDGKFDPDASISRSEFAKLIIRVLYDLDAEATTKLSDMVKSSWDYPYVASANKIGLIDGYPDNTFKGGSTILKQEIIKICASVLEKEKKYKYPSDEDKYLKFKDKDSIDGWVRKYAALAEREGIVVKREDGKFEGKNPTTRGEAALTLYRLFNRL